MRAAGRASGSPEDYDPAVAGGQAPFAMHYDAARARYEPVTHLVVDKAGHRLTVDSRVFSPFVTAALITLEADCPGITPSEIRARERRLSDEAQRPETGE